MKLIILALSLVLGVPALAAAREIELVPPTGTIGLVKLPMLFGEGACDRFQPKAVQLFSDPLARTPLGQVRVSKQWVFAKEGGCSGLEVSVLLNGAVSNESFPTLEYEYEAPAGIVLAKSGHWCQIQLQTRTAWIREGCDAGFVQIQDLLRDKMLHLRPGALEFARETPGGAKSKSSRVLGDARDVYARLVSVETIQGDVWLYLAASHIGSCEMKPSPEKEQHFCLPLRDAAGVLQVWFHPRGC